MFSVFGLLTEFIILFCLKPLNEMIEVPVIVLFIFFESFFIFLDIKMNPRLYYVRIPLMIGYVWRLFFLFYNSYGEEIFKLPNGRGDCLMYYANAVSYAEKGIAMRGGIYPQVMGEIFKIVGNSKLYGQYLMLLCAMVSLVMFVYTLHELNVKKSVSYSLVAIIAILPNFAMLSVFFTREALVTMFASIAIYFVVVWMTKGKMIYFLCSFVATLCGSVMHMGIIGIIGGCIILLLFFDTRRQRFRLKTSNVLPTIFLITVFLFLFNNYREVFFQKISNLTSISDIANTRTEGGSTYGMYVGDSSSIGNIILYTIPRICYFLFSPFPWQWRGISDIVAFAFDGMFYLITLCFSIREMFNKKNTNRYLIWGLFVVCICCSFIFGWGVSNSGTAMRHRTKLIICFATLLGTSVGGIKNIWWKKVIGIHLEHQSKK